MLIKFTNAEARLVTALLDHCRSGYPSDTASELRIALNSLQNTFEKYREDGDSDRIAFTREKVDGSKKTYHCNSKSFVTIEVE
jgi:hypothetical protein